MAEARTKPLKSYKRKGCVVTLNEILNEDRSNRGIMATLSIDPSIPVGYVKRDSYDKGFIEPKPLAEWIAGILRSKNYDEKVTIRFGEVRSHEWNVIKYVEDFKKSLIEGYISSQPVETEVAA